MDCLFLNSIAFPVRRGTLFQGREQLGDYRWEIQIDCDSPPQPGGDYNPDYTTDDPHDVLSAAEPSIYAQMLPLCANAPEELVGREYHFPQSPDDEGQDYPVGLGWPYFVVYIWEHCPAGPMRVAFTGRDADRYRVDISGTWFDSGVSYDVRVQAWLNWEGSETGLKL